jgi:hypothetical protein
MKLIAFLLAGVAALAAVFAFTAPAANQEGASINNPQTRPGLRPQAPGGSPNGQPVLLAIRAWSLLFRGGRESSGGRRSA